MLFRKLDSSYTLFSSFRLLHAACSRKLCSSYISRSDKTLSKIEERFHHHSLNRYSNFIKMGIPFLQMTDDELFPITNLALPAWILLALLPRWGYTFTIVKFMALGFSALYLALILDTLLFNPIEAGINDFSSLDGLLKLFSYKSALFGGWVHYIAFDLWTGM